MLQPSLDSNRIQHHDFEGELLRKVFCKMKWIGSWTQRSIILTSACLTLALLAQPVYPASPFGYILSKSQLQCLLDYAGLLSGENSRTIGLDISECPPSDISKLTIGAQNTALNSASASLAVSKVNKLIFVPIEHSDCYLAVVSKAIEDNLGLKEHDPISIDFSICH